MRRMIFRPDLTPDPAALPLAARSMGETIVPKSSGGSSLHFLERLPPRPLVQWFFTVEGSGSLIKGDGHRIQLPANSLGWFDRDEAHHLISDGAWHIRWWTMDGALNRP